VLSVTAVDALGKRASFSQFNSAVDYSAPGVSIKSTTPPFSTDVAKLYVNGAASSPVDVEVMNYARPPGQGETGPLVDCGLGLSICPGSGGHICIIER